MAMSERDREAFLGAPRIAVLNIPRQGRGPLSSPVWYDFDSEQEPGSIWFLTQNTFRKGKLLKRGLRISMTVQTETVPYAYVSIEGPVVSIEPYDFVRDLLPMAVRYRGEAEGRTYVNRAKAAAEENATSGTRIKVRLQPEEWLSLSFG